MPHEPIDEKRIHFVEDAISLVNVSMPGRVLDIGSGGENIIGQIKPESVVGIDKNREELLEAPEGGLKIVMDAMNMQFLDETFDCATLFYTLLYTSAEEKRSILKETYRVLQKGGELHIWDVTIPPRGDMKEDLYAVRLSVTIPGKIISTGYGSYWTQTQDAASIKELCASEGFDLVDEESTSNSYHLTFRKMH